LETDSDRPARQGGGYTGPGQRRQAGCPAPRGPV